ncbi:MAG: hypothetical protein KF904_20885 [Rhodoblastus sp.]|nr:hypothetical protein [Rhodoblastus sp.]MCO5085455.1 hypothetical protein [Methylobacteriaceae bacterium]
MASGLLEFARARSAVLLAITLAGATLHAYTRWPLAGYVAAPALVFYIALEWPRLRGNARFLVAACVALGLYAGISTGAWRRVGDGLAASCFYPAFLAALSFLRDAAASSPMVERAGRYLVAQPPGRRYVALTFGGHVFGILLNLGGLALLASMLKQTNTLASAGGDQGRFELREKRMTLAVLRGFHSMAMWCPLSITMALLFSLTPGVHWAEYAPYGLMLTVVFLAFGWLFDFIQFPRAKTAPVNDDPGGWRAALAMLAQVTAITLIALAMEELTGVRFTIHILVVVPLFALGWLALQNAALGPLEALRRSTVTLIERSKLGFPAYANEVTLFATAGFLGAMTPLVLREETMVAIITNLHLTPAMLSVAIVLVIAGLAVVGINAMVTVTMLVGALAHAPATGLSPLKLVFVIVGAWSLSNGMSPLNSSMVLLGGVMGRPSETITIRWNGVFALMTLVLFCVAVYFLPL